MREHCRQKILNQHSRMRLLSGEEIGVDQLYIDVYLLERLADQLNHSPESVLQVLDIERDRYGLSKRIGEPISGIEIANTKPKLIIFGKPGSGKTTFLKHLAVDWHEGKFQPELIAVLIELRQIKDESWDFLEAIDRELGLNNWDQFSRIQRNIYNNKQRDLVLKEIKPKDKEEEKKIKEEMLEILNKNKQLEDELESLPLQYFLKQGKFLVLIDGLDEVPNNQLRNKVQNQIHQISENYPKNRFIITCRTQISMVKSITNEFTLVEVAPFEGEQVEQFVKNWFKATGGAKSKEQWRKIDSAITNNKNFKELTKTPVLLTLFCLVVRDSQDIPSDKIWLYKRGINLLLNKWNKEKQIDGWELGTEKYRTLKIENKEKLLMEIAARKFENPKNFVLFDEEELAEIITQQLELSHREEAIGILKAIETQHGLLIERSDELWSFSHLTFQEYFAVQWLTKLSFEKLFQKVVNPHWQNVIKKLVKSQQPSDSLIKLIKQAIDLTTVRKPSVHKFLTWLSQQSNSTPAAHKSHKSTVTRSFYYSLASDLNIVFDIASDLDYAFDIVLDIARDRNIELESSEDIVQGLISNIAQDLISNINDTPAGDLDHKLYYQLQSRLDSARPFIRELNLDLHRNFEPVEYHTYTYKYNSNPNLISQLKQLQAAFPSLTSCENFSQWHRANGSELFEQLRQIMIKYRNIGHNWQFSEDQELQTYYNANKFLVELVNVEGAISDDTKSEIENTILRTWEELQRHHPEVYKL